MKAAINFKPATFLVEVLLYDHSPEGTVVYDLDGSVRERLDPAAQETPEPSAIIDSEALKAIAAEASDHLPPSSAAERHLADAIAVRDRVMDSFLWKPEPNR